MFETLTSKLETLRDGKGIGNEKVFEALRLYTNMYEVMVKLREELFEGFVLDYKDNLENPKLTSTIHLANAVCHICNLVRPEDLSTFKVSKALSELDNFQEVRKLELESDETE